MMCGEYEHEPAGDDEPNYCPNCGSEWQQKSLDDVDWPLEVQAAPRININRYVHMETGIEYGDSLYQFTGEYELLVDLLIHRDGTVIVRGQA